MHAIMKQICKQNEQKGKKTDAYLLDLEHVERENDDLTNTDEHARDGVGQRLALFHENTQTQRTTMIKDKAWSTRNREK
jgi:hypothetical protein